MISLKKISYIWQSKKKLEKNNLDMVQYYLFKKKQGLHLSLLNKQQ